MVNFVKIGDISTQIRGVSYSKSDVFLEKKEGYLPVLRANNIQNGNLILHDLVYIPNEKITSKQNIMQGDIVIAASSGSIDVVGKAAAVIDHTNGSFGAFCKVLRPNTDLVHPRYFANYFQTKQYRQIISSLAEGANINNLRNEHLDNLEILLPPLEEQRRIAAILDQANALRQRRQQSLEKLDQLLQAAFIEMFGDPVSNPKGWRKLIIKDLIKVQNGYAFPSSSFTSSGIPVVKIGNANKSGFNLDKIDYVLPENAKKLVQYELKPGDLLLSLTGTVGKDDYGNITKVSDEFQLYYLNQRVAKLEIINQLVTKNYIYGFFSQQIIKNNLTLKSRGVRQANISNSDIYGLEIPIPDLDTQNKFQSLENHTSRLKSKIELELIQLNFLFESIQQKAFTGRL